MKTLLLLFFMLLSVQAARATHLFGGYIRTKVVTNSALTYEVTVVLYMNSGNAADQTVTIPVCFGDGSAGTASFVSRQVLQNDRSVSIYTYRTTHTFAGTGTYVLTTSLPNRTTAENITNHTIQEPLTLTTTFTTNAVNNQTPVLSIPETGFRIGINQRIVFPLKAMDTEGDSLAYGIAKPLSSAPNTPCITQAISSYQFPNDITHQGTFKLNNRTGDLVWDAPTKLGYYSVLITVYEYRAGNLISQTTQEIPLVVEDLPGTPSVIPAYEPVIEGSIVTAITDYADSDITLTTFPNPVDDHIQVIIQTSNPSTAVVQLMDVNGRKLHESGFTKTSRRHEQVISMDSLTPGIYLLRANVSGRSLLRKIVKK